MLTRFLLALITVFITVGCGNSVAGSTTAPAVEPQADLTIDAAEPVALEDGLPPILLTIPDLDLEADVVPMGWKIAQVDGVSTTEWDVPYAATGWHVTSAGAGTAGNMIISGHQVVGEAVFSQIALGELEEGVLIYVADKADQSFVYEVTTISEPIPLSGATDDDVEAANSFTEPTTSAQLTLITGWPDFSTTHYLFVTAAFVGIVDTN